MKITRAQKIRLGAFMVVGLAILVGTILTLAGLRLWQRSDTYTVQLTENVTGLEVSAPVRYHGLRVGRVAAMQIAKDNPQAIEVTLALDHGTVLYKGTEARLEQSGLTGLKTINLSGGDPRSGRVLPGSELPAGTSLVGRLSGQAEVIARKIEVVANQLTKLTRDANLARTEKLMDNLSALSASVNAFLTANRQAMHDALNGVAQAGRAIAGMSSEGNRTLVTVRKEVAATLQDTRATLAAVRRPLGKVDPAQVEATLTAMHDAMTSLNTRLSSQDLGQSLQRLNKALGDLTRLVQDVDLAVRAGREDFTATLSNLRQAAEDVREFSRIIAQDPSALIRGRERR